MHLVANRISLFFLVVSSIGFAGISQAAEQSDPASPIARKIDDQRLDNAHWLTEKVVSGAQPQGEQGFKALQELGVKTVISVDGARPEVKLARSFGLRYVHLPIGYDRVPRDRAKELAKAIKELDGPIYIHCHHGRHRGPAATVTACVIAGDLTNDQAIACMKALGTGANYLGLWKSAREAQAASAKDLAELKVAFQEIAPVPELAEAMVQIEESFENLMNIRKAGWKPLQDHPDIDPPHEALRLRELYAEIMRTADFEKRPKDFRQFMKDGKERSLELENLLLERKKVGFQGQPSEKLEAALNVLQNTCKACHESYRNAPKP